MDNRNEERANLLAKLKEIQAARNNYYSECQKISVNDFYDISDLVEPNYPKPEEEPQPPKAETPEIPKIWDYAKEHPKEKVKMPFYLEPFWAMDYLVLILLYVISFVAGTIFISIFTSMAGTTSAKYFMVISAFLFILPFALHLLAKIADQTYHKLSHSAEVEHEKQYNNYCKKLKEEYKELIKQDEENMNSYQIALQEYKARCEKRKADYEKAMDEYRLAVDKKRDIANEKYQEAIAPIREKYNIYIENFGYPYTVVDNIDALINILENLRVDSLKEAIAVLKDDQYKADMLIKQERQQLEARKIRGEMSRQCNNCEINYKCPIRGKIDAICPNYVHP